MALPIFAITIFVSAFLLFLVQPLVGKLILPKLGGTPQVWNTCMVFFQSALLAGYAYTHSVSTRLKLRQQLMLHGGLLIVPIAMMIAFPIYATVKEWSPPTDANPIPNTLFLLLMIVGVPFFVVSTSAPLLQKWFAYSGHETARDPYFLYAASNVGSLLSLAVYPFMIEPFTFLQNQAYIWFGGYVFLAGLIWYCAFTIYKLAPSDEQIAATEAAAALSAEAAATLAAQPPPETPPAPTPAPAAESATAVKSGPAPGGRGIHRKKGAKLPGLASPGRGDELRSIERDDEPAEPDGQSAPMTAWRRIRWILLAAVPSSLMLGVTSFVSTDLSPFPLVWVIPLSLYLLSFVLVYTKVKLGNTVFDWTGKGMLTVSNKALTFHDMTLYVLQPLGLLALCIIILRRGFDPFVVTSATMLAFFATALACHGQLAKDRPAIKHLTEYFLLMSVGGMVGGLFNGIFAPIMFQTGVYEFHVAIVVACFIRPCYSERGWFDELILSAFPGFQGWVVQQGDEMAKSMGKASPRTAYLFSCFIDVVFGLFILAIATYMRSKFGSGDSLGKLIKFFGMDRGAAPMVFSILAYGIPLIFCFFFAGRPVRFGLSVLAVLLANIYFVSDDERVVDARRTYFGVLKVMRDTESPQDDEEAKNFRTTQFVHEGKEYAIPYQYTYLMHGTTYHGRCYLNVNSHKALADLSGRKDPFATYRVDLSRLATTYYHRYGPVGVVMERDNWFPGPQNSFTADVKLPTMLVSNITASIGIGAIPNSVFVDTWSEPAFATIGLGSGTMVSYARPYQHMTYYEIDEVIREFSLPMPPSKDDPIPEGRFTYLQNAVRRGVNTEVIMGDARLSLEPSYEEKLAKQIEKERKEAKDPSDVKGNPHSFLYSVPDFKKKDLPYVYTQGKTPMRDGYYRVINVDAFSSDAIPVHLVTKQAIAIYMTKLTQDGVLCVHTSNRHMDLVRPVARIALELSKESLIARFGGKSIKEATENGEEEAKKKPFEYWLASKSYFNDKEKEAFLDSLKDEKTKDKFLKESRESFVKNYEINCLVGKDGADKEKYMGHFSSEYVMIYRGDSLSKWVDKLAADRKALGEKNPGPGQQILNSMVNWYNPYTDHTEVVSDWFGRNRRLVKAPITEKRDPVWTDDYSYIIGVLR